MPVKKIIEESPILLVVDKEELKTKIQERIQLCTGIYERQILSKQDDAKMWEDFVDWNNYNEELIRQAFNKPENIYVQEYRYKSGFSIGALYGERKTFQEDVEDNKAAIKYQATKLKRFYEKIELLKSAETVQKPDSSQKNILNLILLLNRFHKVAQAIRDRHEDKNTLIIKNEYDVQDLLHGLLQIYFNDIRKEEFSPSHAGANSRLDFVLKHERIILEVKMTNENLTINKLGQDLLVDIGRYKEYPDCNDLVIFIYDKGDHIRNKIGLITDLQKHSTSKLKITVIINPL